MLWDRMMSEERVMQDFLLPNNKDDVLITNYVRQRCNKHVNNYIIVGVCSVL